MKKRLNYRRLLADDGGQVLVEFALVIPITILLFLAVLQYTVIVRAAQLVNYAAYVAARSYSIHVAVDGPDASRKMAIKAAAYAVAPVARLAPREFFGIGGSVAAWLGDFPGREIAEILEGYLVARQRLDPDVLGGSVEITEGGSPRQIHVKINYPQPIFIPGLAELWNMAPGKKIYYALAPQREGLGGITSAVAGYESYQALQYAYQQKIAEIQQYIPDFAAPPMPDIPSSFILLFPYVNVRGQCAMGYVNWGQSADFRPRMPADGKSGGGMSSPGSSDDDEAEELEAAGEKAKKANENAQAKAKAYQDAKSEHEKATIEVSNAQQAYDSAGTEGEKAAAKTKLDAAKIREGEAQGKVTSTKDEYDKASAEAQAAQGAVLGGLPKVNQ